MNIKRVIAIVIVLCMLTSVAFAEEQKGGSIFDSIGNWVNNAWNDTTGWVSQAWQDASGWVVHAWSDVSAWTMQAWQDSTKWVSQAWKDSSNWTATNWDHFIVWVNRLTSGDPYSWIKDSILENGVFAYEEYVNLRSFLEKSPDLDQIHLKYDDMLSKLSLRNEDKTVLWKMMQEWSENNKLPFDTVSKAALPYLTRLIVEGESAIGEDAVFSGPVVGQYLVTVLDAMNLDSAGKADLYLKMQNEILEGLTRPTIVGDIQQNILVTDDHYYIEYFSIGEGKYQIVLIASKKDEKSVYPLLRDMTLKQISEKYFKTAVFGDITEMESVNNAYVESIPFSLENTGKKTTGKAVAFWTDDRNYLFYVLTDHEWNENVFETWYNSISLKSAEDIAFEVDMESDGAFYGVNQSAQKYTINRIFDEEKFLVPNTGHGWSAERGNNLIDNLKGVIKGQHSTVIGDNNAKNGADRITYYSDGSRVLIQTKYYSTASRSVAACFDESGFRYIDHVENSVMSIEVPADQYEAAVEYIRNHIENGDFSEYGYKTTDGDRAVEIVKKGNLTYQQAKHIAKAGTVESIMYDAAHACVTAGTAMGISAAVSFAINLWNGAPIDKAIQESLLQGLQTGGTAFIVSVFSSQLAKTGLNTALIPASRVIAHTIGPKASAVIVNAFRPAGSAIYGAAAMQSAAKLLRGNIITSAVTFVVLSAYDVAEIIQGRISFTQLLKNLSVTAVSIGGGALGYIGGAALGTAIFPGAGTVVGIICAAAAGWGANQGAKALADVIAEDDANAMIRILEEQFSEIATEYFLNENEINQSVENLQALLTPEMLKQMYQYKDHGTFARQLIEMAMDPVVNQREFIKLPSEEEYSKYLADALEAIYEDLDADPVTE